MFPNVKREKFQHHIYAEMKVPLLKQAVIYGANGSGKSNFIKAMIFLRNFITVENFLNSVDLDDYIFQLINEKSTIISFEIEFFHNNSYYIYNTDISKEKISEKLSISGLGKTEDKFLFERDGTHINSSYLQNESSAGQLLSMNQLSSLLPLCSRFPVLLNIEDIIAVCDWFSSQLITIDINSISPQLIKNLSQKSEMLNFANQIFENIGIGIKNIEIKDIPFDQWIAGSKYADKFLINIIQEQEPNFVFARENNRIIFNVSVQNGIKIVQELLFDQFGQAGYHKGMTISAQSDGTVRLLMLIPALYSAMYEQKTIVIDEIDNSIHPNLMFELIRFYANNESNGQLIFTTHTTRLLNQQELVRPDEIWLTEKSEGNTKMFSLNDFKLHNTLNIENGYLDGRYGAIPVIEDLNLDL
jgi:AAA15 family ATPase/GTPase